MAVNCSQHWQKSIYAVLLNSKQKSSALKTGSALLYDAWLSWRLTVIDRHLPQTRYLSTAAIKYSACDNTHTLKAFKKMITYSLGSTMWNTTVQHSMVKAFLRIKVAVHIQTYGALKGKNRLRHDYTKLYIPIWKKNCTYSIIAFSTELQKKYFLL